MANRVLPSELKEIIETDLNDSVLDNFITAANLVVTEHLESDTTITDAHKKQIEKWLAAHLLASTREQRPQSEGVGDARISYQGTTGKGLESTFYGQQVKLLDSTGKLAGAVGKKRVFVHAVTSFD